MTETFPFRALFEKKYLGQPIRSLLEDAPEVQAVGSEYARWVFPHGAGIPNGDPSRTEVVVSIDERGIIDHAWMQQDFAAGSYQELLW